MTEFHELVGDGLTPEEETRLRRAHELLLAAGPPPELPPALQELREPKRQLPSLPRPRLLASLTLAAGLAAAAFGFGYLVGDKGSQWQTERLIPMHATADAPQLARASIDLGPKDQGGNWPLILRVTRLPKQPAGGYYELWLTRNGQVVLSCGTFRVAGGTTEVRLNAPYKLKTFDGWVVTTDDRRKVLLTT